MCSNYRDDFRFNSVHNWEGTVQSLKWIEDLYFDLLQILHMAFHF